MAAVKYLRKRRPLRYDGSGKTSWLASELVPDLMKNITQTLEDQPEMVLAAWSDVIGPDLTVMTEAVSFFSGVLSVKVRNATLYSLLNHQVEKNRILAALRSRFPKVTIVKVVFRMG